MNLRNVLRFCNIFCYYTSNYKPLCQSKLPFNGQFTKTKKDKRILTMVEQ